MALFEIFGRASARVHGWGEIGDYELRHDDESHIRLRYDEETRGPFDAEREPWRVIMRIEDGDVTAVRYYDQGKRLQARITDIEVDADAVLGLVEVGAGRGGLYDRLVDEGTVFRGAGQDNRSWDRYDEFTTGRGDDVVRAYSGNDHMRDRGGSDLYDGDSGRDIVSYEPWFWRDTERVVSGVTADLKRHRAVGPDGEVDELRSIEGIRASFLEDTLLGNRADNHFRGMAGDDTIDGRGGFDTVAYDADRSQGGKAGIYAKLNEGWVRDGFGDVDQVFRVEAVRGTDRRDLFHDDVTDQGEFFDGGDGDDRLSFGKGEDTGTGGAGADLFVFRGGWFGRDRITDFDPTEGDRVQIKRADELTDLVITTDEDDTVIAYDHGIVVLEDYLGRVGGSHRLLRRAQRNGRAASGGAERCSPGGRRPSGQRAVTRRDFG